MKKRILIALFATLTSLCCVFAFSACDTADKLKDKNGDEQQEFVKVSGTEGLEYTLSDDGTYYYFSGVGTCTEPK